MSITQVSVETDVRLSVRCFILNGYLRDIGLVVGRGKEVVVIGIIFL